MKLATTDVENVLVGATPVKVIENGQVLIIRGENIYNILGYPIRVAYFVYLSPTDSKEYQCYPWELSSASYAENSLNRTCSRQKRNSTGQ